MGKSMFCGVGCALATPFADGRIDEKAFIRLIDYQLTGGIDALIVCGTTGEASTLTDGEMCDLIISAADRAAGRVPIIAGVGANNTETAVRRTRRAVSAGADAVLAVTPYYNKANDEGLIAHFTAIANASEVPVILYNVPKRTGVNLSCETAMTLFKHPMIQGVKEASSDAGQITNLLKNAGEGAYIYAGNDEMYLPMLSLGARGVISVTANVAPGLVKRMSDAFFLGNIDEARALHNRLLPLTNALFSDVNPIPVKAALSMMGLIQNELRLPLTPLSEEKADTLKKILREERLIDR